MMDIHWRPSDRRLRQFAGLSLALSLAIFARSLTERPGSPVSLAAAFAFVIGIFGLVKPPLLRPLYVGWMIAIFPIGWTVSRLILAIVFYGVFTPLGWCFRILGRDALSLRFQPEAATYWIPKETPDEPGRYFQQF